MALSPRLTLFVVRTLKILGVTPHLRPAESFEERFRFLLAGNALIQFFFGLMIELFIPPLGLFSPLPQFVGTVDNLFFCGCGHLGASLLLPATVTSDDRHNKLMRRVSGRYTAPPPHGTVPLLAKFR